MGALHLRDNKKNWITTDRVPLYWLEAVLITFFFPFPFVLFSLFLMGVSFFY